MPSTPSYKLTAIILASGRGERFGMPKALALFRGKTFVQIIQETLYAAGIQELISAEALNTADMLITLRHCYPIRSQYNANHICIFPVDHPFVISQTVMQLKEMSMAHPDAVIRPVFSGKRGHPIIIPPQLDIFATETDSGLAGIIRASDIPKLDLIVGDPGVIQNINTKADFEAAIAARGEK